MKPELIAVVGPNNGHVLLVLKDDFKFKYTKHGSLIIGVDESRTFINCLVYDRPSPGFYAFGGAKFDIALDTGEVIHCYGQYWDGGHDRAGEILDCEIVQVGYRDIEGLKKCYVFTGGYADKAKLDDLISGYQGKIYGYWEYEDMLKGRTAV